MGLTQSSGAPEGGTEGFHVHGVNCLNSADFVRQRAALHASYALMKLSCPHYFSLWQICIERKQCVRSYLFL